jgi:hypothetical protein
MERLIGMSVRLADVVAVASVVLVCASNPVHAAPFASTISTIANEAGIHAPVKTKPANDMGSLAGSGLGGTQLQPSASVPEPTELLLFGVAAVILGRGLRKRMEQAKQRAAAIPSESERNDP